MGQCHIPLMVQINPKTEIIPPYLSNYLLLAHSMSTNSVQYNTCLTIYIFHLLGTYLENKMNLSKVHVLPSLSLLIGLRRLFSRCVILSNYEVCWHILLCQSVGHKDNLDLHIFFSVHINSFNTRCPKKKQIGYFQGYPNLCILKLLKERSGWWIFYTFHFTMFDLTKYHSFFLFH